MSPAPITKWLNFIIQPLYWPITHTNSCADIIIRGQCIVALPYILGNFRDEIFRVLHFNFCCWEYWKKLSTLKLIVPPAALKNPMLTGILANFRWQSRFVLVRTTLTSSHALSCLLHLLINYFSDCFRRYGRTYLKDRWCSRAIFNC